MRTRASSTVTVEAPLGIADVRAAFERHQALDAQMLDSRSDAQRDRIAIRLDTISTWWESRFPSEWRSLQELAKD